MATSLCVIFWRVDHHRQQRKRWKQSWVHSICGLRSAWDWCPVFVSAPAPLLDHDAPALAVSASAALVVENTSPAHAVFTTRAPPASLLQHLQIMAHSCGCDRTLRPLLRCTLHQRLWLTTSRPLSGALTRCAAWAVEGQKRGVVSS